MRFTLAHELCHSLVDMHDSEGAAWFDDDVFHPPVADYRLDENFANAFAAALLLPPDGVAGCFPQRGANFGFEVTKSVM